MPLTATLKNAYRGRPSDEDQNMKVPQSFSFMCREGRGFYGIWTNPLKHFYWCYLLGFGNDDICGIGDKWVFMIIFAFGGPLDRYAWTRAWLTTWREPTSSIEEWGVPQGCVCYDKILHVGPVADTATTPCISSMLHDNNRTIFQRC
jgi:hypothetical protein